MNPNSQVPEIRIDIYLDGHRIRSLKVESCEQFHLPQSDPEGLLGSLTRIALHLESGPPVRLLRTELSVDGTPICAAQPSPYALLQRLIAVEEPLGLVTRTVYDREGRVVRHETGQRSAPDDLPPDEPRIIG